MGEKMRRIVALIALLATFPPLSTDMYLAAIPLMVEHWQVPIATVNLSLVFFFIAYCLLLLVYGPLSDRFGRKPPLIIGLVLYTVASLLCAVVDNVYLMICCRTLQGAGAASASAISYAICRDLFDGRVRQRIFVQLGVIVAGAPMIAPVIGGWVIEFWTWRLIFLFQALAGVIATAGVWWMQESIRERSQDPMSRVYRGYVRLFSNKPYILLTFSFACAGIPFFAYIGCSSEIFISLLGYSEREYGYFYGVNASAFMLAPLAFSRMSRAYTLKLLLPVSFVGMAVCALPMISKLLQVPYRMVLPMWFLTFFFSFGRPPSNNLLLEQVDDDVGSASSFMVFVFFMVGSLAMWLISFAWTDKIAIIGWCGIISAILSLCGWRLANRLFQLRMV